MFSARISIKISVNGFILSSCLLVCLFHSALFSLLLICQFIVYLYCCWERHMMVSFKGLLYWDDIPLYQMALFCFPIFWFSWCGCVKLFSFPVFSLICGYCIDPFPNLSHLMHVNLSRAHWAPSASILGQEAQFFAFNSLGTLSSQTRAKIQVEGS